MTPVFAVVFDKGDCWSHCIDNSNIVLMQTFPDEATACQSILRFLQNRGNGNFSICTHKEICSYLQHEWWNDDTNRGRFVYNRKQMGTMMRALRTRSALHRFFKKYAGADYNTRWTFRISAAQRSTCAQP